MPLPNFLIIGAAKSGTTSLYNYLRQHPDVFMSAMKEPHFFAHEGEPPAFRGPGDERRNRRTVTTMAAYLRLFDTATESAVGEASTTYLYYSRAPERIGKHIPAARLIAILRHPADRAYSSYLHLVRDGREPIDDFPTALRMEERRIRENWVPLWRYKDLGFYSAQLRRFRRGFPAERMRVYLYEDLQRDAVKVSQEIFRFLGVAESFRPDTSRRHNVSGIPVSRTVHGVLRQDGRIANSVRRLMSTRARRALRERVRAANLRQPPPLSPELRTELTAIYREDILELQDLIERDLSHWLE